MMVTPLCGFCCRRDSVQIDEDDHVPICAECRDRAVPDPPVGDTYALQRVLAVIRRDPGLDSDQIAERLCLETHRIFEILSRLRSRGLIRYEGSRRARTYYAIAQQPQNQQLNAAA